VGYLAAMTGTTDGTGAPDSTAERVALWRAAHVALDDPPHVLVDDVGLRLADPGERWLDRPDMGPASARNRASMVARARLAEDVVAAAADEGVRQYVILGAGLDTFAQREAARWPDLRVFEIDQRAMQAWKRARLDALGLPCGQLVMVPMDFEAGDDWPAALAAAGFDRAAPAVVAALGVTMYLTRAATIGLLNRIAAFAPGSGAVLTVAPPAEDVEAEERPVLAMVERGAAASGHPWRSHFSLDEIATLARDAGLRDPQPIDAGALAERYFAGRADGLRPSSIEVILTATV
jgi:methyltransferase (TIGR00027 family)